MNIIDSVYCENAEKIMSNTLKIFDYKSFSSDYLDGVISKLPLSIDRERYMIDVSKFL
jgi:hypothetical protein